MSSLLKGKIYKIVCNITGEVYIGSTTKTLEERLKKHEYHYKEWLDGGRDITSFQIIERGDYRIELIEEVSCESKTELYKIEGQYQREIECVNKYIAGRTGKEYREDNKEKIKQYYEKNKEKKKEYYEEHKEEIKEYQKEYYKEHKEGLKEYQKEYREEHKEEVKERQKKYYEEHKEEINEKKKEKINCECGVKHRRSDKARHLKSKKHQKYLKSLE